jgi:glycosyltransferase involved in cell wall biosynthesis
MRVLLATHFFPPNYPGGTETYTLGLAKGLRRLGHESYVICADEWGSGGDWHPRAVDTSYDGIPVRRLHWNWELAPDPFIYLYDNEEVEAEFSSYLQQLMPDVVHVTSCYSLGAGILRASRRAGTPTLLTLTDFWFLCPRLTLLRGDGSLCSGPESAAKCAGCMATGSRIFDGLSTVLPVSWASKLLLSASRRPQLARLRGLRGYVGDADRRARFLREAFEDVDIAIAPSQVMLDTFVSNGYPASQLHLSHYGVDVSWASRLRMRDPGTGPVIIGYIGQIDRIKGVDLLVRAFTQLPPHLSAELRIYGNLSKNDNYAAELRGIADGNPGIRFMGPFDRSEIAEVLSQFDALVVPSIWYENTPLAISEAFAAGKPVIATNLGGMTEQVRHGVNGLLFERGDVEGLLSALTRFLSDPELRGQLRLGPKPVRTIESELEELLSLYAAAITSSSSRDDPAPTAA